MVRLPCPVILFAGDMLFYGEWGSGYYSTKEKIANVALWRLHLGSITAPVGIGFALLAALGLWLCCRRAAPRLAAVMLACLYAFCLLGILEHGIVGPLMGGWSNIAFIAWYAVLALTYNNELVMAP